MSYHGLGFTFGGKIGGSVEYNGGVRTSGSAEGKASADDKSQPKKTHKPVTTLRTTYRAAPLEEESDGFPWLWVGVGAGALLLIGGVAYAATRK